jgi:hypothetical protein
LRSRRVGVNVELQLRARPASDFSEIRIIFTAVIEYEIAYEEEAEEYIDVRDPKFLKLDDGSFYITLDPDPLALCSRSNGCGTE